MIYLLMVNRKDMHQWTRKEDEVMAMVFLKNFGPHNSFQFYDYCICLCQIALLTSWWHDTFIFS